MSRQDDEEFEPIEGLPRLLPAGERILWQGRPTWRALALHTFQSGWVAAYFALLGGVRAVNVAQSGKGLAAAAFAGVSVVPLAALCIGLLVFLSVLHARATVYTITNRRVVMRFGVALPMSFNLPYKRIGAADLHARADGNGDIALQLAGPGRLAYLHLWPHTRPWRFARSQPMLRGIADARAVATLLAEAVASWSAAAPSGDVGPVAGDGEAAARAGLGPTLATANQA